MKTKWAGLTTSARGKPTKITISSSRRSASLALLTIEIKILKKWARTVPIDSITSMRRNSSNPTNSQVQQTPTPSTAHMPPSEILSTPGKLEQGLELLLLKILSSSRKCAEKQTRMTRDECLLRILFLLIYCFHSLSIITLDWINIIIKQNDQNRQGPFEKSMPLPPPPICLQIQWGEVK